jgi:hypothetical protein
LAHILFDVSRADFTQIDVLLEERPIAAEIDPNVTILLVRTLVEQRPVPGHAHQLWTSRPTRVKLSRRAVILSV